MHPIVIARYLDEGETILLRARRSRGGRRTDADHSPEERALIAFLDRHFPDGAAVKRVARANDARYMLAA